MFAGACFLAGSCLITGCGDEAGVEKTTTVTTPSGTATKTETSKVETSGEAPPVAAPE